MRAKLWKFAIFVLYLLEGKLLLFQGGYIFFRKTRRISNDNKINGHYQTDVPYYFSADSNGGHHSGGGISEQAPIYVISEYKAECVKHIELYSSQPCEIKDIYEKGQDSEYWNSVHEELSVYLENGGVEYVYTAGMIDGQFALLGTASDSIVAC